MRPVFHSSELIRIDTRDCDPVGFLPPQEGEDDPHVLDENEAELEQALRVPGDSQAGQQLSAVVDQNCYRLLTTQLTKTLHQVDKVFGILILRSLKTPALLITSKRYPPGSCIRGQSTTTKRFS